MDILYSDKQFAVCVKPVGLDSEAELPEKLKETLPDGKTFYVNAGSVEEE